MKEFQWTKKKTQILICQKADSSAFETDEGPQTVMDAHRRWATVRNERMGIVLEVTHTDDGGREARDEQKDR